MNTVRLILIVAVVAVVGGLIYMLIDGAISLDNSRMQNTRLRTKCELLARLADEGLRGRATDVVIKSAGANVITKIEGPELSLDDVILRVQNEKIAGVDMAETCR